MKNLRDAIAEAEAALTMAEVGSVYDPAKLSREALRVILAAVKEPVGLRERMRRAEVGTVVYHRDTLSRYRKRSDGLWYATYEGGTGRGWPEEDFNPNTYLIDDRA